MSIEQLNKAATAAGFAMATPDEDAGAEGHRVDFKETGPSRAVALVAPAPQRPGVTETLVGTASGWLKSHLPTFGGRQPA